jgi:uncharacterized protein RhaS with RHS repeats
LYYYGARYYDPRISLWLSTDPLQEKYPNISTYAYTFQNPVKYIDPDGKDGILIVFPNYEIATGINIFGWKPKLSNVGRAGVLLIDNKNRKNKII